MPKEDEQGRYDYLNSPEKPKRSFLRDLATGFGKRARDNDTIEKNKAIKDWENDLKNPESALNRYLNSTTDPAEKEIIRRNLGLK